MKLRLFVLMMSLAVAMSYQVSKKKKQEVQQTLAQKDVKQVSSTFTPQIQQDKIPVQQIPQQQQQPQQEEKENDDKKKTENIQKQINSLEEKVENQEQMIKKDEQDIQQIKSMINLSQQSRFSQMRKTKQDDAEQKQQKAVIEEQSELQAQQINNQIVQKEQKPADPAPTPAKPTSKKEKFETKYVPSQIVKDINDKSAAGPVTKTNDNILTPSAAVQTIPNPAGYGKVPQIVAKLRSVYGYQGDIVAYGEDKNAKKEAPKAAPKRR